MKIALVTDSFLPGIGGTENVVLRLATELSKNNEVIVCAPRYRTKYDESRLPFKVIRPKSICFTKNECWGMPDISCKFKKEFNKFAPDIIHCHTMGIMADYANRYAKKHDIKVIYTIHTRFRECYRDALKINFLAELLLKFVTRRTKSASIVTTVSNGMINELKSYGVKKDITVIRNGGNFREQDNIHIPHEKFNLLFVGRLISYKNIDFILDSLFELKKIRSDFKFVLVGNGPKYKSYVKKTKALKLNDCVEFIGAISDRKKLAKIYSESDLLLFASGFDSDGLVILEAGAYHVPSLVFEGTNSAERITNNVNGFTASTNKKEFAKRISDIMDDKELLNTVSKNSATIFRTWEEITKEYYNLYKETIKAKGRR